MLEMLYMSPKWGIFLASVIGTLLGMVEIFIGGRKLKKPDFRIFYTFPFVLIFYYLIILHQKLNDDLVEVAFLSAVIVIFYWFLSYKHYLLPKFSDFTLTSHIFVFILSVLIYIKDSTLPDLIIEGLPFIILILCLIVFIVSTFADWTRITTKYASILAIDIMTAYILAVPLIKIFQNKGTAYMDWTAYLLVLFGLKSLIPTIFWSYYLFSFTKDKYESSVEHTERIFLERDSIRSNQLTLAPNPIWRYLFLIFVTSAWLVVVIGNYSVAWFISAAVLIEEILEKSVIKGTEL